MALIFLITLFVGVFLWARIKAYIDVKKAEEEEKEKLSKMSEKEKEAYYKKKAYKEAYGAACKKEAQGGLPTMCPRC